MAGGEETHFVSPATDVTGGIVVKNDGSSLTIKEKGTDVLKRLFFVHPADVFLKTPDGGISSAKLTSVVVDNHTTTKDKIKEGMRAKIVYYAKTSNSRGDAEPTDIYMQSVQAISNGELKSTK